MPKKKKITSVCECLFQSHRIVEREWRPYGLCFADFRVKPVLVDRPINDIGGSWCHRRTQFPDGCVWHFVVWFCRFAQKIENIRIVYLILLFLYCHERERKREKKNEKSMQSLDSSWKKGEVVNFLGKRIVIKVTKFTTLCSCGLLLNLK